MKEFADAKELIVKIHSGLISVIKWINHSSRCLQAVNVHL